MHLELVQASQFVEQRVLEYRPQPHLLWLDALFVLSPWYSMQHSTFDGFLTGSLARAALRVEARVARSHSGFPAQGSREQEEPLLVSRPGFRLVSEVVADGLRGSWV